MTEYIASITSQESLNACSVVGDWSGILDIGMMKMTLVLHIQQDPHGALSATVDTLEHKINGTPIDWISFDGESLKFEMKAAFAKFEGSLIENESEISGQFLQAGQSFPLASERGIKSIEAPNRPQEPKLPYPYTEEHVSIVLMAGAGVNGEELLYAQDALIKRSLGETEETIEQSHKFQEQLFALLKKEPDPKIAVGQFHDIAKNHMAILQGNPGKITLDGLEAQANCINTEWFRYFLVLDPRTALKQVQVPVLTLNGELDLQVPPMQNLPVISKSLAEGGNKDFTIVELPKLNHLFQTCQNGSIEEYAKIEETISPSALNLIAKWVLERTIQKENKS